MSKERSEHDEVGAQILLKGFLLLFIASYCCQMSQVTQHHPGALEAWTLTRAVCSSLSLSPHTEKMTERH